MTKRSPSALVDWYMSQYEVCNCTLPSFPVFWCPVHTTLPDLITSLSGLEVITHIRLGMLLSYHPNTIPHFPTPRFDLRTARARFLQRWRQILNKISSHQLCYLLVRDSSHSSKHHCNWNIFHEAVVLHVYSLILDQ